MSRFQEALRAANNLRLLAAVGRSGGELGSIADLIDNFLGSPQLAASVERLRAVPEGAALLAEHYPPLQPDIDRLRQLPPGTLGRRYADLILSLGYDPEFFRPRDTGSDDRWLTQRIATTHDIHHVVAGFGTEAAGENGVLAITAPRSASRAMCCSPAPLSWPPSASSPSATQCSAPPRLTATPSPARPSAWRR